MSLYPPVKVGLLGLGTVGGGVTHVLARNAEELRQKISQFKIVKDDEPAEDETNG